MLPTPGLQSCLKWAGKSLIPATGMGMALQSQTHNSKDPGWFIFFFQSHLLAICGSWYRWGVLFHKQSQYKKGWLFGRGVLAPKGACEL